MAIEIEWRANPADKEHNGTAPRISPLIADSDVIGEQRLVEIMEKNSPHSRGQIKGVLADFAETLAALLREGKTIDLPSLGTFRLSIASDTEVTTSTAPSARRARANGVNFQPCKELKQAIATASFRTVARNAAPIAPTAESLIPALTEYLEAHQSITRAQFSALFHLKRTTAYLRLRELMDKGIIRSTGNNQETRYVRGENS